MKKVCWLAKGQIVLGICIAFGFLFLNFNIIKFRKHELAIGDNLKKHSLSIRNHRELVKTSADSFSQVSATLPVIATGCNIVAETIEDIPYVKKVAAPIKTLHNNLNNLAAAMEKSQLAMPQTLKAMDQTANIFDEVSVSLEKESPITKIVTAIQIIAIIMAIILITNGAALLVIAKEQKQ